MHNTRNILYRWDNGIARVSRVSR